MPHLLRALAALALLLGAGCGGGVSSEHNSADVAFARQMIGHHRQAVQMAGLAPTHDAGPQVRALAKRIASTQAREVTRMNAWLEAWGEEPVRASDPMGSGMRMQGMQSAEDLVELDTARGAAFDDVFLTQMIEHHRGAVAMARAERSRGRSEEATDLAGDVVSSQTDEIAEMRRLLAA